MGWMRDNAIAVAIAAAVGVVVGWLASVVVGGATGMFSYIVLGIVGAVVSSYLFAVMQLHLLIADPVMSQIMIAAIGAVALVGLACLISRS